MSATPPAQPAAVARTIGAVIRYRERDWSLVGFADGKAVLRSHDTGETIDLPLRNLAEPEPADLAAALPTDSPLWLDRALFDRIDKRALNTAVRRLEHLYEAECGYRSGQAFFARKGEPRSEYDPKARTRGQRYAAKANQLGCAPSTLYRHWRRWSTRGYSGLVDLRMLRARVEGPVLHPTIEIALIDIMRRLAGKSTRDKQAIRIMLRRDLDRRYGREAIVLPSESTLNRAIDAIDSTIGVQKDAATRHPGQRKPKIPYGRLVSDRPGAVTLIDSTPLNILARDPSTGQVHRPQFHSAMSHSTRMVPALRLTDGPPKGVDASMLLLDVIRPANMNPHWPAEGSWRFHGVPSYIVTILKDGWRRPDICNLPALRPEQLVVDGAWIYRSRVVQEICRLLDIDLQIARPMTPTDKAHIERYYATLDRLLRQLPGYIGRNTRKRGAWAQHENLLYADELQDLLTRYIAGVYHTNPHRGLPMPGRPERLLSPEEAFDEQIARTGLVYVAPDPELYYQMLPTAWLKIGECGVRANDITYDADILDTYRGTPSPWALAGGKYPFKFHPDDRSRLLFHHEGGFVAVDNCIEGFESVPFGELSTVFARRMSASRGAHGRPGVEQAIADILSGLESPGDKHARKALRRDVARAAAVRTEAPDANVADPAFVPETIDEDADEIGALLESLDDEPVLEETFDLWAPID